MKNRTQNENIFDDYVLPCPKKIKLFPESRQLPDTIVCRISSRSVKLKAAFERFKKHLKLNLIESANTEVDLQLSVIDKLKELPNNLSQDIIDEAYKLEICESRIVILAVHDKGLVNGLRTLQQIISHNSNMLKCVKIIDWPDFSFRGTHLTLGNGYMPDFNTLKRIISTLADYKINYFVIEYDDRFPWEKHPAIVHPAALTKNEIKDIVEFADEHYVEVIPLLDSLGHADQYLKHPQYAHLRELPDKTKEMCASNPQTLKFIKELWTEVLELHPNARYAHITGDEVFRMGGFCSECAKFAESGRLAELFNKYYTDLSGWIMEQGKIPMMWGDMLIKHPEGINQFPKEIVINDWCYWGVDKPYWEVGLGQYNILNTEGLKNIAPEALERFGNYWLDKNNSGKFTSFPHCKYFIDHGLKTIGSTAASASRSRFEAPPFGERFANNKRFAMTVKENGGIGLLNTYWSMHGPIDAAWFGVLAGAEYSWHVRNEVIEDFNKRFEQVFLGKATPPETSLLQIDNVLNNQTDLQNGFKVKAWDENNRAENLNLGDYLKNTDEHQAYANILNWSIEFDKLSSDSGKIFNTIDELFIGSTNSIPLNFQEHCNNSFTECIPGTQGFDMESGKRKILDIDFNFTNNVILVKGGKQPSAQESVTGIPLEQYAERIYFIISGYDVGPAAHVADLVFHFKNGSSDVLPLIQGKNLSDWSRPPATLSNALIIWSKSMNMGQQKSKYAYLTWWNNPNPDLALSSMELNTTDNIGYPILFAATSTCRKQDSNQFPEKIETFNKDLNDLKSRVEIMQKEFENVFSPLTTPQDLNNAKKKTEANTIKCWIETYRNRLETVKESCKKSKTIGSLK